MFYRLSTFAIAAGLFSAAGAQAQEVFPAGTWSDGTRSMIVRIGPCPSSTRANSPSFCGVVVEDKRVDTPVNPPGHLLVRDLTQSRNGWRGRVIDGTTSLNLTMTARDNGTASARYCLGIFCENDTWTRVAPNAPVSGSRR
jgi:uncharacterized protein (DUF2147 family)